LLFDAIEKMADRRTGFSRPVIARMAQKVWLFIFGGFTPSEAMLNLYRAAWLQLAQVATAMTFGWSHCPVDSWF
jgi:hypothetical protein